MKTSIASSFIVVLALLMGITQNSSAADNSLSAALKSEKRDFNKINSTEIGFSLSSLNGGTSFTSLAINREFGDWFTGGIRGLIPLNFAAKSETYATQLYGRFPLLNGEDVIYIEPAATQAFFSSSSAGQSMQPFFMLGASYAYFHRFGGDFTAGVNIGVDYSPSHVTNEALSSGSASLYSHVGLTGGYYF